MKIGIDGRGAVWYRGTGIGTYTDQLLHHLMLLDQENHYSIFYPEESVGYSPLAPQFRMIPTKGTQDNPENNCFIQDQIQKSSLDIYHVPQNGLGLPKEKNCSYVITLHDVIPYVLPETCSKTYLKTFMEEMDAILRLTDRIITVSQYSKKDIHQVLGFPMDRIHVTPLAPEAQYQPLNKEQCKAFLKNRYGIDRDFILYIGGINPRKNIGMLMDAFSRCKSKLSKDYALVIGGKLGRSYESLKQRCDFLSLTRDVLFPGYIPLEELPLFYNGTSLFVYPSVYEGFGLPPLEAMACGTPTICSNATSIPEVVGDAALLMDPHDPEGLAEAIRMVLEDPKLGTALRQRGLTHAKTYSWEKTALETIKIYTSFKK